MATNGFTPIQSRMLEVLSDGMPHIMDELHACLNDDLGPRSNIYYHISNLRQKLRPRGQDIICEFIRRRTYYRHVQLLKHASDE